MILNKNPELVIFDLDNTLYEYKPCHVLGLKAVCEYIEQMFGISQKTALEKFEVARMRVKSRLSGASARDRILYFSEFLYELNLRHDTKFLIEVYQRYWTAYFIRMRLAPGVHVLSQRLRQLNVKSVLVTDLMSEIQYRKLITLEVEDFFDVVVTSQETQLEKASNQPFELLAKRLRREEWQYVWFIGDSKQDFPNGFPTIKRENFLSPFAEKKVVNTKRIFNYEELVKKLY